MPFDANGNYTRARDWTDDAAAMLNIEASLFDEENDDFATAHNLTFLRDGRAAATGPFNMQSFRIDLDNDQDTSLRSSADDTVDLEIGGSDLVQFTATGETITQNDDGAAAGPSLVLNRNSTSAADDDEIGQLVLRGNDDASAANDYAAIVGEIQTAAAGGEDGRLSFRVSIAGTLTEMATIDENGFSLTAGTVQNGFRGGALVYLDANQSLTNLTWTAINFDQEDYDTDALHDNATNNSRLTVPTGITRVRLTGKVGFQSGDVLIREATFRKNGLEAYAGRAAHRFGDGTQTTGNVTRINIQSPILTVTAGDYFELYAFQDSGGALNALGDVDGEATWFAMELIE